MGKFSSTFTSKPLSIIEKIEKKRQEDSEKQKSLGRDWERIQKDFETLETTYKNFCFDNDTDEIRFGTNYEYLANSVSFDSKGFLCILNDPWSKDDHKIITEDYDIVINWVIERIIELTKE